MIVLLSPLLLYIGISYGLQSAAPTEKAPWVHWNGIDPAAEVYISWETAELEESQVEWGTNPSNLDNTLHNSTAVNVHHIKLDGLTANTRYYYRTVRSETSNENTIRTFKTAPISDQDFNVTFISDTQQFMGTGHYDFLCQKLGTINTDFIGIAGDVGQEADDQETWNIFWKDSSQFTDTTPIITAPGNHDDLTVEDNMYTKYFGYATDTQRAFYSFNWSNTQFVMAEIANMGDREPDNPRNQEMYTWLNETLAAGQDKAYRVLVFHRNVFSSLGNDEWLTQTIIPVVEQYNVSVVMYGHMHSYERFYYNNHTYVCLGGGGGMQNSIVQTQEFSQAHAMGASYTQLFFSSSSLIIKTMAIDGDVIDETILTPQNGQLIPNNIVSNGGMS